MNRITLLLVLTALSSSPVMAQDEPNYKLEDRFHRIFEQYNQKPTSEEAWSRAFGISQPREYEVMKQDTLWDISKVLFADPFFWPKIWSFNEDILNPHQITPGQIVRFFPGTLESAPSIAVVQFEGLELPAPRASRPIAEIPDSLPSYTYELPDIKPPQIIEADRTALSQIPPLPLPVEILDEVPARQGQIVEIEEGSKLAGDTRDIYVRLDIGSKRGFYTVIKNTEKTKNGFIVQYRGEIEVLERINDRDNIYRAQIRKIIDSVEEGDYIIGGRIPEVDVSDTPTAHDAPFVRIIGGYRSPTDLLFAPFSIVFLNGGERHGLQPGMALKIYQNPKIRVSDTKVVRAYREVGKLKILRTQNGRATAYILASSSEIREGDFAGVLENPKSGQSSDPDEDDLTLE